MAKKKTYSVPLRVYPVTDPYKEIVQVVGGYSGRYKREMNRPGIQVSRGGNRGDVSRPIVVQTVGKQYGWGRSATTGVVSSVKLSPNDARRPAMTILDAVADHEDAA